MKQSTLLCAAAVGWLAMADAARADVPAGLAEFRQSRFAEAYEEWTRAAESGDPNGALFVGVLYDTGLGVPQDDGQALDWYRRAADAGSATGAFNAGVMYDAGRGVAQDRAAAARWYARAAAKGFARAEYNLALMTESGDGVRRDRKRAIALYTRAAEHGITAALPHLSALGQPYTGASHDTGDGAMRDFQQAQKLLLARGPGEAERAIELFHRAAAQHNPLAAYDLGYCYEHGLGTVRDPVQALSWYRRAAAGATDPAIQSIAQSGAATLERDLTPEQRRQAETPR